MPQRVVGRNTRAEQGSGFFGRQTIRNGGNRLGWRNHVFGIASIKTQGRDFLILANDELTAAAGIANETMPSMPAYASALAGLPERHVRPYRVNSPSNFMPGHARVPQSRPVSLFYQQVAVANAAGLDLNSHLAPAWVRDRALDEFEISSGAAYLDDFHVSDLAISCPRKLTDCMGQHLVAKIPP